MKDKTVKITKDSNSIHGYFTNPPIVGERFILTPISFQDDKFGITTGKVLKVLKNNEFQTSVGTYKYEFI